MTTPCTYRAGRCHVPGGSVRVLEETEGRWRMDQIGTVILITDAEPGTPAYIHIPALDLRDNGLPSDDGRT